MTLILLMETYHTKQRWPKTSLVMKDYVFPMLDYAPHLEEVLECGGISPNIICRWNVGSSSGCGLQSKEINSCIFQELNPSCLAHS